MQNYNQSPAMPPGQPVGYKPSPVPNQGYPNHQVPPNQGIIII